MKNMPYKKDNKFNGEVQLKLNNPLYITDDSESGSAAPSKTFNRHHGLLKQATCCKIFGCRGFVYVILMLMVSAFHFTIFTIYSWNGVQYFARYDREYLWVFLLFSILFILFVARALTPHYWRKFAKNKYPNKKMAGAPRKKSPSNNILVQAHNKYQMYLGLNGKYYLWNLHLFEFIENYVSIYNMRTIYLCSLPHYACIIMMSVLVLESTYRAYSMAGYIWKGVRVSKAKRDFQISLDIFIDVVFLIIPLGISQIDNLRFTIDEILLITLCPSISLLSKLRKMLQETMEDHTDHIAVSIEHELASRRSRQRNSLFGASRAQSVEAVQNKNFPRWAKVGVFALSTMYAFALLVVGVIQLATVSQLENQCECFIHPVCNHNDVKFNQTSKSVYKASKLFSSGCRVKTPFCSNLLTPKCNCAVFEVEGHPLSVLSKRFVELTALRRVSITRGRLRELPLGMEKLREISFFDLSFNPSKT